MRSASGSDSQTAAIARGETGYTPSAGVAEFREVVAQELTRTREIDVTPERVLIANGKKDQAQQAIEIAFWRAWRLFMTLTGPSIDYLTPLHRRLGKLLNRFTTRTIANCGAARAAPSGNRAAARSHVATSGSGSRPPGRRAWTPCRGRRPRSWTTTCAGC